MRPVLLLAGNFVREQRWLTLLLVLYAVGGAALFGYGERRVAGEDVLFFLHQQSLYAVLFSVFLATSAIHNERKSRRILAVLSKAVTRRQYLAGLLGGIVAVVALYCLAIGLAGTWLVRSAHAQAAQLWTLLGVTTAAALLVSAVALFFATFLHPLFATAATALAVGVPFVLEQALGRAWGNLLPVYALAMQVSRATLTRSALEWQPLLIAIAETLLLWVLGAWIFSGRDITVALE